MTQTKTPAKAKRVRKSAKRFPANGPLLRTPARDLLPNMPEHTRQCKHQFEPHPNKDAVDICIHCGEVMR